MPVLLAEDKFHRHFVDDAFMCISLQVSTLCGTCTCLGCLCCMLHQTSDSSLMMLTKVCDISTSLATIFAQCRRRLIDLSDVKQCHCCCAGPNNSDEQVQLSSVPSDAPLAAVPSEVSALAGFVQKASTD